MSALHRLKAYFGMVPVEEFDAAEFDGYQSEQHSGYHAGYLSPSHDRQNHQHAVYAHQGYEPAAEKVGATSPRERDRAARHSGTRHPHGMAFDEYGSFAASPGHPIASRAHSGCPAPRSTESRSTELWPTEPWGSEAPVRGSLAIDPAAVNAARIDGRASVRQPVAPQPFTAHGPRIDPRTEDEANPLSRIVTLHPHSYNEARPIGERYREGNPVIMNLTAMEDRDAKRLVDFAAGLAFALRGSIDKVTNKVFLLSPPNVDVSAEDRRRIAEGRFFS
ncbi:MAG: cell division protein SepF [Pseudonocardiaceae bacterium]